jgi:putative inorganic carbon (HCO3(-)) transporter
MWARVRGAARWLTDREVWFLAAAVAAVFLSARWAMWGLAAIAGLWLLRWLGWRRLSVSTPIDLPALLLAATVPVTLWVTSDVAVTRVAASRLVAGLALAYGLANWGGRRERALFLAAGVVGIGVGLCLLAPLGVAWPQAGKLPFLALPIYRRLSAVLADTINANMLAGALVVILPVPVAWLLGTTGPQVPSRDSSLPGWVARALGVAWVRWACLGLGAAGMAAVLVLTQSRGGWIAAGAALFVALAWRWPRLWWLAVPAAAGLGVLAWRGGLPRLLDLVSFGGSLRSWEGRQEIWSRAIYMIQDFPFTGIGAGTFGRVANVLYPFFLLGPDAQVPHAHNLFLQVAVDLGIPGLIAYLALLIATVWAGLDSARFYRRAGDGELAALAWAGVAGLAGMAVHGLVDATTWIVGRGAFVPWLSIGLILALAQLRAGRGYATRRPSRGEGRA